LNAFNLENQFKSKQTVFIQPTQNCWFLHQFSKVFSVHHLIYTRFLWRQKILWFNNQFFSCSKKNILYYIVFNYSRIYEQFIHFWIIKSLSFHIPKWFNLNKSKDNEKRSKTHTYRNSSFVSNLNQKLTIRVLYSSILFTTQS